MTKLAEKTLLIGSGKGGVGKSTVAVNLAVALAREGYTVGLVDADLYGPSIPLMLGLRNLSPQIRQDGSVIPIAKFGLHCLSLGFFIEEARSIVWRGPMLHKMLEKMLLSIQWGKLDYLLIDLPPGTGDVLLSLTQILEGTSSLIVTTPQEASFVDVMKAVNAFDQLNVPLIGLIENMAGYLAPDTGKMYFPFGESRGINLSERLNIPFLGTIPLIEAIREGGDAGIPCAFHLGSDGAGHFFRTLASKLTNS